MKKVIIFLISILFVITNSFSQNNKFQKESVKVWGNCGMCKVVIEKAASSIEGVKYARWNSKKRLLKVKFLTSKTDLKEIQKAISSVGYDTEFYRADDEVYNSLHYCCKYERNIEVNK